MSLKPLNDHYSFTAPGTIHDEEAMTALELAGRTTKKVNETVNAFNELERKTNEMINKTMPEEVTNAVQSHIDKGEFDKQISDYAGDLEGRLDNLISTLPNAPTTMDAEVIDVRVGSDGVTYPNAGTAIRSQFNSIQKYATMTFSNKCQISFDTVNRKVSMTGFIYLNYGKQSIVVSDFDVTYNANSAQQTLYYDLATSNVACANCGSTLLNRSDILVMFVFIANNLSQPFAIFPYLPKDYYVDGNLITTKEDSTCHWFMLKNGAIEFDTTAKTMTITTDMLISRGTLRVSIPSGVYSYDLGDTRYYFVYDELTQTGKFVPIANATNGQIKLFTIQTNYLTDPWAQTFIYDYYVDGERYSKLLSTSTGIANKVCYVDASTGNDSNDGTNESKAVKTIRKAVELGANIIYAAPGNYRERLNVSGRRSFSLYAKFPSYTTANNTRPKINIDASEDISLTADNASGLRKCAYTSNTGDMMYSVFIGKTVSPIVYGERSNGHNVALWDVSNDVETHVKLTPVLTLAECQSMSESWFYDGSNIYVNGAGSSYKLVDGDIGENLINNCENVHFENVRFQFFRKSALSLRNVNNASLKDCEFNYSGMAEGVSCDQSNATFDGCVAHHNRNDGFNFHSFGHSTVLNCSGFHNYDDGISHHDGHTGCIIGGEWHHNKKGGISSPTYGCAIDVYNAVCHDNEYGILMSTSAAHGTVTRNIIVSGCALYANKYGLVANGYNALSINNKITGNTTDISGTVTTI